MGIYNCGSTLQEALDSLYSQTFQDFEIILCDDGSTDNTYEVASKNQQTHSNIVLLRNERNMGLNQTLNNCLAVAEGSYIARMDGDDRSLPTRFAQEVKFLDEHPEYAIVSGPMNYFDENGIFRRGVGHGEVVPKDFVKGTPFCHAPCMVRREAYMRVGGYSIDKNLLRVEDYHLWFKMYAAGFRGYNLHDPIYEMRDDRNAYTRRDMRTYWNLSRLTFWGVGKLNLPFYCRLYALRHLIVGMLPIEIYAKLHKSR